MLDPCATTTEAVPISCRNLRRVPTSNLCRPSVGVSKPPTWPGTKGHGTNRSTPAYELLVEIRCEDLVPRADPYR